MGILRNFITKKAKKLKPRTQAIDPKLPRGKVGKGPLEPTDSKTRVISGFKPAKKKKKKFKKFAEPIGKDRPTETSPAMPSSMPQIPPGMKGGGTLKSYKAGGGVCAGASNNRRQRQGAEIVK